MSFPKTRISDLFVGILLAGAVTFLVASYSRMAAYKDLGFVFGFHSPVWLALSTAGAPNPLRQGGLCKSVDELVR